MFFRLSGEMLPETSPEISLLIIICTSVAVSWYLSAKIHTAVRKQNTSAALANVNSCRFAYPYPRGKSALIFTRAQTASARMQLLTTIGNLESRAPSLEP